MRECRRGYLQNLFISTATCLMRPIEGLKQSHFHNKLYISVITFTQKKMHIISAQNTNQRPSLRSIFKNFLRRPHKPPLWEGVTPSPPPTPTPVSALRASKCPYRPLAPCPFQILAGALIIKDMNLKKLV